MPGIVTGRDSGCGLMNIPPPVAAAGNVESMKLGIVKEPALAVSVHTKPTRPTMSESTYPPIITEPPSGPPDQVTVRGWLRSTVLMADLLVHRTLTPTFNVALKTFTSWPPVPAIV